MRSKWIAAGVSVLAMALPATAMAGTQGSPGDGAGGASQAQLSGQWAATLQGAVSQAQAAQNTVNTNAPTNTAGNNINGAGGDNATQNATNVGLSAALNGSKTKQDSQQTQIADPSGGASMGGPAQAQGSSQWAATLQGAQSQAKADQNAVNANTPSNTAGNDINGAGGDNATQNATNGAGSLAGNGSKTDQKSNQYQDPSSPQSQAPSSPKPAGGDQKGSDYSSSGSGSGGAAQLQGNSQWAATLQAAQSDAKAKQNAVNTNAPVNVAGNNINGAGGDNATQNATNVGLSAALNGSKTDQSSNQTQNAGGSCAFVCGGPAQAQFNQQNALTGQYANSSADAHQNTVNANVPVNIAGNNINGAGGNNATQNTTNGAGSLAGNLSSTTQSGPQSQTANSNCIAVCGGAGQLQSNNQNALTLQGAFSSANAKQNAVNANVPVNVAGNNINGAGGDNATQNATNLAGSAALNGSKTDQSSSQTQDAGSSCLFVCGGTAQAQFNQQNALTGQYANSSADAHQNAVNANVPVNIAGNDINGAGGDNATQNATNAGGSLAGNLSGTGQMGGQQQTA
jgi:hypothetical protein